MPRYLRKFVDWLNEANDEEIEESKYLAVSDIECERCYTKTEVYFFNLWDGFFYCMSCIEKLKAEPFTEPQGKGLTLRFRVLERDNFTCVYCGRNPSDDGVKLEVDHIFPKSRGGTDELANLVTSCRECNQGKKDLIIRWDR
jgi:hypothetical protein